MRKFPEIGLGEREGIGNRRCDIHAICTRDIGVGLNNCLRRVVNKSQVECDRDGQI